MREGNPTVPNTELCERMLCPDNIGLAVQNVKRNNGSAGVDGMEVSEIDGRMREDWARIRGRILARKYKPQPVRRVHQRIP
jgi:retron-type reverse transcriptase